MNFITVTVCLILLTTLEICQSKNAFFKRRQQGSLKRSVGECPPGESKCPNSEVCIRDSWFCDGDNDCGDGSDEPSTCPNTGCSRERVKCPSNNICIKPIYFCDGSNNCGDNSDEQDCESRECPAGHLRCQSGQCIKTENYCSGRDKCEDDTPLYEQHTCPTVECEEGYRRCPHLSKCIRRAYFCDGDNDCRDNTDEMNCESNVCLENEYQCPNGRCLDKTLYCTGKLYGSCRGSDVPTSEICADVVCPPGYDHKCLSDGRCIRNENICNGYTDCQDGSDESQQLCNMPIECDTDYKKCPNTRRCIRESYFCDGDNDCGDNADESLEICNQPIECSPGYSSCPTVRKCIRDSWFCDGDNDCGDNSDEANCVTTTPTPAICLEGQEQCPGRRHVCVTRAFFCDTDDDCGDNSDEDPELCSTRTCFDNEVRCDNGQCLDHAQMCLGYATCRDGSITQFSPVCYTGNPDRPFGVDPETLQRCVAYMNRVRRVCVTAEIETFFGGFQGPNGHEKLIETDLADICQPASQVYSCATELLQECVGITQPMFQAQMSMLPIAGQILDYVCVEHIDVINRYKPCLLRLSTTPGRPQTPQIFESLYMNCSQYATPGLRRSEFCFSSELQSCAKSVIADQCGDEIAEVLNVLATRVRQTANCDTASLKSRRNTGPLNRGRYLKSIFKRLQSVF